MDTDEHGLRDEAGEKRRRAATVQNAGALAEDYRTARSVLDCASPLALWNGAMAIPNVAGATGRVAHARCRARTEIKWGRTPHSLPRRSNSPRRNAVKTGAKTGAFRT